MTDYIDDDQPQIFLSFAGANRSQALSLKEGLEREGFEAFLDEHSIKPGQNIISAINNALTRSSYFVLLWSDHTRNRPWPEMEWTAALSMELNQQLNKKRTFLFVVRVQDTELPPLLAPRKYLDAFHDQRPAAKILADTWRRDRGAGLPVIPAPKVPTSRVDDPIELFVRNRELSVLHVVAVPSTVTGLELLGRVREDLQLRDGESSRIVSVRFTYELRYHDKALEDQPLTELGVKDEDTIDLLVKCEVMSRVQTVSTWDYRDDLASRGPEIKRRAERALIDAAFRHLMP